MLRYISILMVVLLVGCATSKEFVDNTTIPPEEVAQVIVQPDLKLPAPLDLEPYNVPVDSYRKFDSNGITYIGVREEDMMKQNGLLLVLKNRIYELQEIINTYNNSN